MSDLTNAVYNTLIGMGTVFLVLIFISLIISLFVYVPNVERAWGRFWERVKETFSRKQPQHGVEEDLRPAPKRPQLTKQELADYEAGFAGDDNNMEQDKGALIAVIMAAIVASEGGAVSADRLVVRSIRRVRR